MGQSDLESPLRVGILLDATTQPRWIAHMLALVAEGGVAQITTTIIGPPDPGDDGKQRDRNQALYHRFIAADRRIFRRQPDPGEPVELAPLLGETVTIRIGDGPLAPEAIEALDAARLDVILCPGSPRAARHLVACARLGVWYFPDLRTDAGTERPVGFAETVAGRDVVTTSLNVLTPEGAAGRPLVTAASAVNRYSPHYTDRRVRWTMAGFPARTLTALARTGALPKAQRQPGRVRNDAVPGNGRMLGIVARLGTRLAAHAVRSAFYRSEWTVAWRAEPKLSVAALARSRERGAFTFIENPPDRFWADPFPVRDGETAWLFVEEFPHRADRAHLAVMALRRDGTVGPATTVLARPWHLSYPFVFRWRDEWYLVPETLANRAVDLYRSTRFPFDWVHERTLLADVPAVDATLVEHDGRWWLFTTIAPYGGSENDELHIYMADTPLGPWQPHPGNPQKSDVRGSRPAGRIFARDGALYRPAQDCSRRYGYAMTIQRIVTLTADQYEEAPIARIEPTWAPGLLGTHTLNHAAGMTLVDGDRWRPRFGRPFRR